MSTTTCTACKALGSIVQCNRCRKTNPNKQTILRNAIVATMAQGATVADAEHAAGVTAGPAVG